MTPMSLWVPTIAAYAVMSVITFCAYGLDKWKAKRGKLRIRERTLHLLELFGGWPGAIAGQVVFHHKSRKVSYLVVFWGIVVVHVATFGVLYWMVTS